MKRMKSFLGQKKNTQDSKTTPKTTISWRQRSWVTKIHFFHEKWILAKGDPFLRDGELKCDPDNPKGCVVYVTKTQRIGESNKLGHGWVITWQHRYFFARTDDRLHVGFGGISLGAFVCDICFIRASRFSTCCFRGMVEEMVTYVQTMNRFFTNSIWKHVHIFIYIPGTPNNHFLYKDLESSKLKQPFINGCLGLIKWYLPGTLKPTQFWI